jgi:hypothetical protein
MFTMRGYSLPLKRAKGKIEEVKEIPLTIQGRFIKR